MKYKNDIALPVIVGLIDVLMCCIICKIIYEGRKVNLVINDESSVQFIREKQDDSSDDSSDCSIEYQDQDEEDWCNDSVARRESFERKLDNQTAKDSFLARGEPWFVAGQLTAQFLSEIEDYLEEDKEVAEDD